MVNFKKLIELKDQVIKIVNKKLGKEEEKEVCNIPGCHAHRYVSPNGFARYIVSEQPKYKDYEKTGVYRMVTEEEKELLDYLNKKDILSIKDNYFKIKNDMESHPDFYQYYYRLENEYDPEFNNDENMKHIMEELTRSPKNGWTTDKSYPGLTGEMRRCTYEYYAYKIEKDENGEYIWSYSPNGSDILITEDEYPYISENYFVPVEVYPNNPNWVYHEYPESEDYLKTFNLNEHYYKLKK